MVVDIREKSFHRVLGCPFKRIERRSDLLLNPLTGELVEQQATIHMTYQLD
jgi:hypothetical protein